MNRSRFALVVVLALVGLTACSGCGAPKAKTIEGSVSETLQKSVAEEPIVEEEEEANGEAATSEEPAAGFDHSTYAELLAAHVRYGDGRVDYASLKAEEAKLDGYLKTLATADLESLGPDDQLALLLNAYNAYTLKLIVENYGDIKSIRDLKDPWATKRYEVAGDTLSLDDIEHGLIRPIFKDPRIHFAVNCASIGCPPLADFAFTGAQLDEQLDEVTARALANPRYAKVKSGKLYLTKIMDWYGEDFTKEGWDPIAESLPAWVAPRATDDIRELVKKGDPKVAFMDYDWNLNDVE